MSTLKRKADTAVSPSDPKKAKANGNIASFFGSAPKPAASSTGAPEPAAPKFDKEKWVAGLTEEQRELLKLEIDTLHESWLAHLKDDITTSEFLGLKKFLQAETKAKKKWFPPAEDVYSWYVVVQSFQDDQRLTSTGPAIVPSTKSRLSSSDKTPITTITRPTVWPSPSDLRRRRLLL